MKEKSRLEKDRIFIETKLKSSRDKKEIIELEIELNKLEIKTRIEKAIETVKKIDELTILQVI